jgi:hypothetical protein
MCPTLRYCMAKTFKLMRDVGPLPPLRGRQ